MRGSASSDRRSAARAPPARATGRLDACPGSWMLAPEREHGVTARVDGTREEAERFEALLDRCERSRIGALPFDDLGELGRLYRRHLARLARLRSRGLDTATIAHLNALCLRAHTALYVPE